MKAVLLAAGLGTRLYPLTARMPKCMVRVNGTPVLQHNIDWLRSHGITDLAINLHHHAEVVQGYFRDGSELDVSIRYSLEDSLLGTAGAVRHLRGWLNSEEFLVIYADNITTLDLSAFVRAHHDARGIATVGLYWRADVRASGVAELTPEGNVKVFIEKPQPGTTDSHWINSGVLCCDPRLLDLIPEGPSDFGYDVLPSLLDAGEVVAGYQMSTEEILYWIDTPEDLAHVEASFASHGAPK